MLRVHASLFAFSALSMIACSSEDPPSNNPVTDTGVTTETGADADVPDPITLPCTDVQAAVYGDPGMLPAEKGAVLKCAKGERIDRATLEANARKNGYKGKPFTSGAHVYRILYRTERGDPGNTPGYSSAIVYLPDTPRAAKSPLLLVAHGSRGQAPKCAPSLTMSPEGEYVRGDFENQTLPLVGAGLPVIAPDGAGYANYGAPNNPINAYNSAADLGKSMLDGTRAFQKLAPSYLDGSVVLYGHSQGGHTALATLALAEAYGVQGTIKAVVTFAPLWLSQRSWGAINLLPDRFNFTDYGAANFVSILYHYAHGELLDGPGRGGDVFKPEKRAQIKELVDKTCWAPDYPAMKALGSKPTDIFDPAFSEAIGPSAGVGGACPTDEPKKTLCEKWIKRYLDDRPHLTGAATKVPILFLYGNQDPTIPPDRVTCARDRLKEDMANLTWCVEAEAKHDTMLHLRASYAVDWLLAKTTGSAEPPPCPLGEKDIPATCDAIPPND